MPELFGIDIAALVNDAISGAGGLQAGTLIRQAPADRSIDDLTSAPTTREVTFDFQGFVATQSIRREDTLIVETVAVLTIIGRSIQPLTTPLVNDRAEINEITYELTRLIRSDPASAVYEFEVG